jgi:threonine aldolase
MAGLAAFSEVREVDRSIGELKNVIAHSVLEANRFTNVVNTPSEVAGNRNGCRVSILHLHIAGTRFWQVVMCSCDSFDKAKAAVDEVANAIRNLKFF